MRRRVIKKFVSMLLVGTMVAATVPLSLASPTIAAEKTSILKGKKTMCTYQGDSGHGCQKAVDEKFTKSRWGANNKTPQAIQFDMGAVYEIDTIKAYLFGDNRKYTYEYYVTMEPTILKENGGNGDDNFVGKNPVVTGLEGVGYGWADPDGSKPIPDSKIHSEDYTFKNNKPVGRYLTLRVTKCSNIICVWDVQAFGTKVDDNTVRPRGDVILEAEKGTLSGVCEVRNAESCSNGQYVGKIGEGADNTITWKANVATAGTYTLDAYFLSAQERDIKVKVNDDAEATLTCQKGEDWNTTLLKSNKSLEVKLKAGENTITIGNAAGAAPNVDCIALTLKEAEKVKPEGDLILEAEKGTLSGKCEVRNSADCSNGQYVGYIGEGVGNTVTWKANVEKAGIYSVDAYFLSKQERSIEIKVNDDAKTTLTCQAGIDWETTVVKSNNTATVKLNAGENTIIIGNDGGEVPNVDCIALTLKEEIVTEPVKPTDAVPIEPSQPTGGKATEPSQPTGDKATEPSQPADNKATEPSDPAEGKATEPSQPTGGEATKPSQPAGEDATKPSLPSGVVVEPSYPADIAPTEPSQPTGEDATKPSQPVGDTATEPSRPTGDETVKPSQPVGDTATEPSQPSEAEPTEPTPPAWPIEIKPTEPNQPTQPSQPTENIQPSETQPPVTERPSVVLKGDIYWYKNLKYKVTKADASGKGTVELVSTKNKKVTTVIVPATIKIEGRKYNVTSIGKSAFENCKKLKKIVIKTIQLKKVGKNAFKGIKSNAKIQVPSSKWKKYTSLLQGRGQSENVKILK